MDKLLPIFDAVDRLKIVDCSANPYDLRPALNAVKHEIEQRTKHGPLVVVIGENHSCPAHVILSQPLISHLCDEKKDVAYGLELPHNALEDYLYRHFDQPLEEELQGKISAADFDGANLLKVFSAASFFNEAPVTFLNVLNYCQSKKVPVHCNDVASKSGLLDSRDALTRDIIQQVSADECDISVSEPLGVALRNRMIAQNVINRIDDVDVYIQQIGLAHLFGENGHNPYEYKDSLIAQFIQAGINVLPVLPTGYACQLDDIPSDAFSALEKAVIIDDISDESFMHYFQKQERSFLKKLSKDSGGEIHVMKDISQEQRDIIRRNVQSDIPAWITQAKAHTF